MHLPYRSSRQTAVVVALLVALAVALVGAAPAASSEDGSARAPLPDMVEAARAASQRAPAELGRERLAVPEDRYAMAGGCYTMRAWESGAAVGRDADGLVLDAPSGAEPFHFQATDLGSYLLYGTSEDFVAASEGRAGETARAATGSPAGAAVGGVSGERTDAAAEEVARGPAGTATGRGAAVELAPEASDLADWEVERADDGAFRFLLPAVDKVLVAGEDGRLGLASADGAGAAQRFALELAEGCAAFPEVEVNVDGPVAGGPTPYGEVRGYLDAHLHMMAFEFLGGRARCGRPWHPYGVEHALRGCKEHELAGGRLAALETVLSGSDPVAGHDTNAGWPTFTDWPRHNSYTYEQVYYKWMERAWRGGLRMFTNLLVDNNQLCKVYPYKRNSCNEMDGVRLQAERIHELERYIDAQYGGPGRGWFRIVSDPFQARRIMNEGKLAVVLGIEVSVLFDCGVHLDRPQCGPDEIDERMDEVYAMGVRQMELVNKFDNALSGVAGDAGNTGVLVNGANFLETGSFWRMQTCEEDADHGHDRHQHNIHDNSGAPDELTGRDALAGMILQATGGSGAAPAYPQGPHCNQRGLTELGEHVIRRMMATGMIFDPDHMSAKARAEAMDVVESEGYSGVVSSHGWADETIYPRILRLGGVVTPYGGGSEGFVQNWRRHREWVDDRFYFGFGYGADTNGFGAQGPPRGEDAENPVTYPFTGFGGAVVDRQVSGERTYDINADGVSHYGLYPDWIEDLRRLAGDEIVADMERGPEAYLQMWERAAGIAPDACRDDVDDIAAARAKAVRKGMSAEETLLVLGQPSSRTGDTFMYCVEGGTTTVTFDDAGRATGMKHTKAPKAPKAREAGTAGATGRGSAAGDPPAAQPAAAVAAGHDHRAHVHGPLDLAAAAGREDQGALRILAALLFLTLSVTAVVRRRSR